MSIETFYYKTDLWHSDFCFLYIYVIRSSIPKKEGDHTQFLRLCRHVDMTLTPLFIYSSSTVLDPKSDNLFQMSIRSLFRFYLVYYDLISVSAVILENKSNLCQRLPVFVFICTHVFTQSYVYT